MALAELDLQRNSGSVAVFFTAGSPVLHSRYPTTRGHMIITKRIATAAAVTAISLGSVVAPAMASSKAKPKHLTSSQCASAKTAWVKKHPHATSKQKAVYNKVLKAEGCTVTV